jgi:hypothetical protein
VARASLKQFLASRRLDGLRSGMTIAAVEELLGPPDDSGGASRRFKQPSIYLYGNLEIHFRAADRNQAVPVHIDHPLSGGAYRLPACWTVEDWGLTPGLTIVEVEQYLRENSLGFTFHPATTGLTARITVDPSGVELVFDEFEGLHSLSGALPP